MASAAPEYDYMVLDRELDRTKAQIFLGNNAAFLGPLMCATTFEWCTTIETCDTDGETIRWNPADFLACTPAGRVSSLLHELGHIYRLHPIRRGTRCPDVWNIACDICINRDLLKFGYKLEWAQEGIGPHPEIKFELEEQIYDYLQKPGGGGAAGMPGHVCGGMPLNPSQATKQHMINSVVQAMHSAVQNGKPGDVPGNVKEIIKQFLAPVVPWNTVFYRWMDELSDEDFSWQRPNRRFQDIYLPSRVVEETRLRNLMIFQDVSGSIGPKDSIRFNSELKFVWETFKPEKMTIVQFDTKIQKVDVFEGGDPFDEIVITGRGGTSLVCVKDYILEHKPTAVVIFSDLEVSPMTRPDPGCPILWVAISNKNAVVPYGQLIHIRP